RKKDIVISTNKVGIASNILFAMNLIINSLFQSVTIENEKTLYVRCTYSVYIFIVLNAQELLSFDVKVFCVDLIFRVTSWVAANSRRY
uniref:hypothetical protein n=1 Tax=Klebsiella pneumoniae TaxID=573 RepID=UPI0024DE9F3C